MLMGLQLLSPGVQLGELSLPRVLEQLAALLWQESPTQLPPQPSLCRSSAPRCSTPTAPSLPCVPEESPGQGNDKWWKWGLPVAPGEQNSCLSVQPHTGGFLRRQTMGLWRERHSYLIGHGFKKDGCSRDFLLVCHEPVGQVASVRQVQAHDAPMGFHQGGVHCEVGRGAWTGQTRGSTIASAHAAPGRTPSSATRPSPRSGQNRLGHHMEQRDAPSLTPSGSDLCGSHG